MRSFFHVALKLTSRQQRRRFDDNCVKPLFRPTIIQVLLWPFTCKAHRGGSQFLHTSCQPTHILSDSKIEIAW